MTFPLSEIPSKLDQLVHRCNVGHAKIKWSAVAAVECHAGTSLPKRVSGLGELAAGVVVFRQEWHCCGDYSCSSGNQKDSGRKRCSATAMLKILSTGVIDEFVAEFEEPPIEQHGDGYVAPSVDAPRRYVLETRVRLHEVCTTAIDYDEMIARLAPHLRPVGPKAIKEYKRRFQNLTQSRKRPAAKAASTAKKSRSSSKNGGDADNAAAALVGLSSLLERREAQPWRDRADVEFVALPDIDQQLAALTLQDADEFSDRIDVDDDVVTVTLSYDEMFTRVSVAPMLALLEAKSATADEHAELETLARQFISRFRLPDNVELASNEPFEPVVDRPTRAAVPLEWWKDQVLLTAKSTAQGQCLFSSIGLLLCESGSDAVSLWLRGRCVFELVEHWALYTEWFNAVLVRDMLHSLVGSSSARYGYSWPTSEVILLLANVLERRIVVVKNFSRQLSKHDPHTRPHVHLPLRCANVDEWRAREPFVLVFTGDHYRPLKCSEWSVDFQSLPVEYQVASVELSLELRRLSERGCCGKVHCHQATD
jgi:hypothetical protein